MTLKGKIVTAVLRIEDEAEFKTLRVFGTRLGGMQLLGLSASDLMAERDRLLAGLESLKGGRMLELDERIDAILTGGKQ